MATKFTNQFKKYSPFNMKWKLVRVTVKKKLNETIQNSDELSAV